MPEKNKIKVTNMSDPIFIDCQNNIIEYYE